MTEEVSFNSIMDYYDRVEERKIAYVHELESSLEAVNKLIRSRLTTHNRIRLDANDIDFLLRTTSIHLEYKK